MIEGKNILLISPEPWGVNFVSKHHYANYLAKNNTVYFLNPPSAFSRKSFGKIDGKTTKIKDRLIVVDYINLLPKMNKLPKSLLETTFRKQAKLIQKLVKIPVFDIVWSFDPFRFFDQNIWSTTKKIYHSVDFHPEAKYEEYLCRTSDLVLAVTELIKDELTGYRKDISIITHGADVDGFSKKLYGKVPGENIFKACYVGNFHKHIDYNILEIIFTENTDTDFIMIGPALDSNLSSGKSINQKTFDRLSQLKNVFFIGSIPSDDIMGLLSSCDINLVLFKKQYEKVHCSPHKLMAYFYSGNITLSNYIDAHKNTDPTIIIMVKNQKQIPNEFKKIKENIDQLSTAELCKKRRDFALLNSYENKIIEISNILYSN